MQSRVTKWLSTHIYEHPKVVALMNTWIREFLHRHYFFGVTLFMFCAAALLIIGHFFNYLLLPVTVVRLKNTRLWPFLHSYPVLGVPLFAFTIGAALIMGYCLIYPLLPILLILWVCVINEGVHALKDHLDGFVIFTVSLMFCYWLACQSTEELQNKLE